MHTNPDVIVVGARAAGASTAMLLARRGHRVALLDRAEFPSDTISTHQIARSGVVQLARWGLLDAVLASGAPALRSVTFTAAGMSITRPIKDKAGVDLLVAPRRYVLDSLLVDAAREAGADVRTGVRVTEVIREDDRVCGVRGPDLELRAPLVIGADGLGSTIARAVGAETIEQRAANGAGVYAYYGGIPWDGIELIASAGALAGVFPTHHGEACVWVCMPADDFRRLRRHHPSREAALEAALLHHAPELSARLLAGHRRSPATGMSRLPNYIRRAHGPGWALVGDAGYHRDPVTGHGISDAFRDAELLADAVDAGGSDEDLAAYQRRRDAALREVFEITCALADYPPVPEFVALQKRLSVALDVEAEALGTTTH
ncbi:NAD(P)/FAD-dependent oxidoreductase [Nocardioides sp. SR21]|uniref:NAD(P)/FAD-dependent oxidoreductase n=1 Tax=Nocardioides sp. SR21 TaxID=2919501 RepID=UPI001FA9724B|nr:NAD(P)/FAD-dependent oxidoreductase [Nocardioides sp. SR21]